MMKDECIGTIKNHILDPINKPDTKLRLIWYHYTFSNMI